ncbi:Gfo/Idh/MocA family protein [Paenibacillus contaminans]|uniref:Gfo/Idh/MocA family protein n=1 Tax=Paenibacillus contaminans TaxID=450362 RepID=UPI0026C158F1
MLGIFRIGIAGIGIMGTFHADAITSGAIQGAKLAAICDSSAELLGKSRSRYGEQVAYYGSAEEMMTSGEIDGILVATPHYDHPQLAIQAFAHGLHVLIEKPAGVYTKNVREMNEAAKASGKVFAIMYNQRLNPMYQKLRELIESGELGEIRRTNWIVTNWYRTQSYYNMGSWRATWKGEGGGVLINQCPHQLDLWHWTTLLTPKRIRAHCQFGKHRSIEVENEVTAYVEYENGASGVFVTSTAESPGTNRFEVAGSRGKIVIENGKMSFSQLRQSESEFNAACTNPFGSPECWNIDIPVPPGDGPQHKGILQNWTNAVLNGEPLIAPGQEGIHGLMLSNAMLLSTWTDQWVDFPIDEERFYNELQQRIRMSESRQEAVR